MLLGGGCLGSITLGTNAFSSMVAKQSITVNVAPDNRAIIGYEVREDIEADDSESEYPEIVVAPGENEERTLVTIVNRLEETTTIQHANVELMTQSNKAPTVTGVEWDKEPFSSTADIRGSITCGETGSNVVELTVTIGVRGATTTLSGATDTRRFVVRCEPESSPDLTSEFLPEGSGKVAFDGLGQVKLKHDNQGVVDVKLYVGKKTGARKQMSVNPLSIEKVNTNEQVGGSRFSSESIVGVQIGDSDSIYLHPSWNQGSCAFDRGSGGTVVDPVSTEDIDPSVCTSE